MLGTGAAKSVVSQTEDAVNAVVDALFRLLANYRHLIRFTPDIFSHSMDII